MSAVQALLYLDLRVRREGLDLWLPAGAATDANAQRQQPEKPDRTEPVMLQLEPPVDISRDDAAQPRPPRSCPSRSTARPETRWSPGPSARCWTGSATCSSNLDRPVPRRPARADHARRPDRPGRDRGALASRRTADHPRHRVPAVFDTAQTPYCGRVPRAQAEAEAAAGDYTAAVRSRFRACVAELTERTVLDERAGRTAYEAVADAGRVVPALREPLQPAAVVFTEVVYGNRPGTAGAVHAVVAADEAARKVSTRALVQG